MVIHTLVRSLFWNGPRSLNKGEALQMAKSELSLLDNAVRYVVKQDDNHIINTF